MLPVESKISQDPFDCLKENDWRYSDILIGIVLLTAYRIWSFIPAPFGLNLFFDIVFDLLIFFYPFYLCNKRKIKPLFNFIKISIFLMEFLRAVGFYLIMTVCGVLLLIIVKLVIGIFGEIPICQEISIYQAEHFSGNPYLQYYAIISTLIVAPVVEEVFFRGFLYNALKAHFPLIIAVMIQAMLFSFVHNANPMDSVKHFLCGIALAIIYERRKSLLAPILVHVISNVSVLSILWK